MTPTTIDTVLVANRGEISSRVIRTLRHAGVRTVAVYSDADVDAPYVSEADLAIHIGPAPARESYLVIEKIIDAATRSGAQAIHPGYGFLSENAEFATACADNGIIFMGPPASAIETMGDKISARAAVEKRNVPTVPGLSRPGLTDEELIEAAPGIGFPVLIKPSAGGGGKGMHRVETPEELPEALVMARREAGNAFGDDSLFLEHFVDTPRHIEVQILADTHGNVVHLGERECSLQRRHQKVIEEAPSPLLDATTRAAIGEAACDAARSVGYVGAGTVEFIVPAARPDQFFFMEMNTRLQVEHPVTEEVTGLDLVALQLRIAEGREIDFAQEDVTLTGHSIEARIYAEDPANGFLPTGGTIDTVVEPRTVRVDSGITDGSEISSLYDPMLMKVISHGQDRAEALTKLDAALAQLVVSGITVNTDFCRFLLAVPEVVSGDLDTGLLDRVADQYIPSATPVEALAVAALADVLARDESTTHIEGRTGSAWGIADGWRLSGSASQEIHLKDALGVHVVDLRGTAEHAELKVTEHGSDDAMSLTGSIRRLSADVCSVELEGVSQPWRVRCADVAEGTRYIVASGTGAWDVVRENASVALADQAADEDTTFIAPMPGTVIAVNVNDGAHVEAGESVLVLEAMKMEHVMRAAVAGTVTLHCAQGDKTASGDVLATIEPHTEPDTKPSTEPDTVPSTEPDTVPSPEPAN